MLILGTTTDKIQVTLSSAITTNQLDCIATYKDITTSAYSGSAPILVTTNNTTAVDLVPAPASNTQRIVDFISIYNNDTANATVIVTINRNGSIGILFKCTLKTSESLVYSEGAGWNIHSNDGSPKQSLLNDYSNITTNKNYLINPNFKVIQGAVSGTLANSNALPNQSLGYLGKTNWYECATGGTPTYAYNATNESVTFTGAASTTNIYFGQRIESSNVVTLANKVATMTLSVELSNSLLTAVTWEIFRPTTSNDVHGTIGTPTQTLIASGTWNVNSTLTRYNASFTLPTSASTGLDIRLRVGAQTSGTWVISRLKLEEGSIPTTFSCEDYSQELFKCQRHFIKSFDIDTVPAQNAGRTSAFEFFAGSVAAASAVYSLRFPNRMFVIPSVTLFNPSVANAQVRNQSRSADCSSSTVVANGTSQSGIAIQATGATAQMVGDTLSIHYSASAQIP
jgi:hypothetical protein